ncbi:MAG: DoxX family protein [Myxococcaceae bacterium]|nr:DoxX family protein [Myxococcaceae bacterium]
MHALAPIGRLLFAAIFISSGVNHFLQVNSMTAYASSAGLPAPRFAILASGVIILLGGLCVLLGVFARLGAALLALFLLATAFTMHRFWGLADPQLAQDQLAHFMKNLSMAGGALIITYFGPGPFSLRVHKGAEAPRTRPVVPFRPRPQQ